MMWLYTLEVSKCSAVSETSDRQSQYRTPKIWENSLVPTNFCRSSRCGFFLFPSTEIKRPEEVFFTVIYLACRSTSWDSTNSKTKYELQQGGRAAEIVRKLGAENLILLVSKPRDTLVFALLASLDVQGSVYSPPSWNL